MMGTTPDRNFRNALPCGAARDHLYLIIGLLEPAHSTPYYRGLLNTYKAPHSTAPRWYRKAWADP